MTSEADVQDYQSYIQRLEAEIDDLTAALSQAWDQLVPFLQEVPMQAETASDIAPILQAVAAAADTEMAGVYLFEANRWIAVPESLALAATAEQQLRTICADTTVELQLADASLLHWAFAPILAEDRVIGVLGIGANDRQHAFTAVEMRIVARMAERIGSRIAAVQLARSREREAFHAREMQIAGTIQQSIQPQTLPQSNCLRLVAYWQPASQVGGDAWGWVQSDNDQQLAWFVLDVSGKGLPAALAAVSLHTAIRLALRMRMSPVEVLRLVNAEFYDSYTRTNLLATVVILTFDAGTQQLALANAGHPPVLLRRNGHWQRIPASVPPIGVLPDLRADPQQFRLQHQDLLICHSDGFTEIETPLRLWGQTGLLRSVPAGRNLEQINQAIVAAAQQAGTIQDDQTLVSAMCMAE